MYLHTQYAGLGYQVGQLNFLMGFLCSIEEDRWEQQLLSLGVPNKKLRAAKKACLRVGVDALHLVCNCHHSALLALRSGSALLSQGVAPSQMDRPPDRARPPPP